MKVREIRQLYDAAYAVSYDDNYLVSDLFQECTRFELSLIGEWLTRARNWLDVACGTGYFLSQFPTVDRAGIDISPAMLAVARNANSGIPLCLRDFRDPIEEWRNRWDLVTSMWFAYAYADSVDEIDSFIRNLAAWTSPTGVCFLPVCDPDVLCKTSIPHHPSADSTDGHLTITGVVWSWVDQPSGRQHTNLIAPHLQHMVTVFRECFQHVRIMEYPRFQTDGMSARKAIIASDKLPLCT
jgi:SAM-dependent methyltransferase